MNINSRTSKINFTGFASDAIASFTGLREAPIKLRAYINAIQEGSGDPAPDNIRPISGRDSITITANSVDYDISLGDTIYGGSLDVTTGVLTVTHEIVDLGTLNYTKIAYGSNTCFYADVPLGKSTGGTSQAFAICSQYVQANSIYIARNADKTFTFGDGYISQRSQIKIVDNDYANSTVEQFKTAMNGVQLVYELATPITVQLTPTQIYQIIGSNSISSDSGNVEVYYVTI